MTKCANCAANADYTYTINPQFLIHYCTEHLPKFLTPLKVAGRLALQEEAPVVEAPAEPVVDAAPAKSKKSDTPVVDETPAEPAPAEEPAPTTE
jgi:hypothetical protein